MCLVQGLEKWLKNDQKHVSNLGIWTYYTAVTNTNKTVFCKQTLWSYEKSWMKTASYTLKKNSNSNILTKMKQR